jgi:rhodanese-related sulfurtransferase
MFSTGDNATPAGGDSCALPSLLFALLVLAPPCSAVCAEEGHVEECGSGQVESSGPLAPTTFGAGLPELRDNRASGPYCGIYSLYACLSALGIETELEDYVSTKYVGSFQGSTAKELIDAAKDFGAQAECFSHLTHRELKRLQTPMVLHMRTNWADGGFNHWVAFLGYDGQRMRIVDPPHPMQTISAAELLANWDGTGIGVSEQKVDHAFLFAARVDYLIGIGLLLPAIYVLRRMFAGQGQLPADAPLEVRAKTLALHVGVILGFSFVLGLGYHASSEVGFLRNPTALAEVTRRHYATEIPELSLAETEREIRDHEPLVLDARRVSDYRRGALPGARSMSAFSTLSERQQALTGVPKAERIILYCQSARCAYADEVAKFLKFNGYENLAIFRDGYRVWRQAHASTKAGKNQKASKESAGRDHVG